MNWPVIKLRDLQQKKRGSLDPSKNSNEIFTLYSIPAYDMGEPQILRGSEIGSSKQLVSNGDVLISKIVPHIRRAWVVDDSYGNRQIASGEWIVFNSEKILPVFFRQFLLSDVFHRKFMTTVAGVGGSLLRAQPRLVADFNFSLPPLAEQQRIAALLDTADRILKLRESAIAKLDQLAQSVFVDMFGSQTWEVHKLSTICDLQNGYAFKSDDYVDKSDVLNCRMSNIRPNGDFDIFYNARYLHNNFSEKYKEFLLNDGDVIIAMTDMAGEPKILGVPTIVDTKGKKLLLNQRVGKLVFKKQNTLNIDYLKFALTQRSIKNYFKKFANGGVQINLGKSDLLSVPISIPSYEQQIIFSQKIQKIFKLKHIEITELDKIKNLQSSLQHQSFAVN